MSRHLAFVLGTLALLALVWPANAAPQVLQNWTFDQAGDRLGWQPNAQVLSAEVKDGLLQGTLRGSDAFLTSPQFALKASPYQVLEFRLKTDAGGSGEIYFTNTLDTPYAGFTPGKSVPVAFIGDGEWHDYRLYPYWQAEGKLILLRFDFPVAGDKEHNYALDYLRVVDEGAPTATPALSWAGQQGFAGWTARGEGTARGTVAGLEFAATGANFQVLGPAVKGTLDDHLSVYLRLRATSGARGELIWATAKQSGLQRQSFGLRADGQMHSYNLDLSANGGWAGEGLLVGLAFPPGTQGALAEVALTDRPQGPADVEIQRLAPENALNRAGRDLPLLLTLENHGAEAARGLKITDLKLPRGVAAVNAQSWTDVPAVPGGERLMHRLVVRSQSPNPGAISVTVGGPGLTPASLTCPLAVLPALNLPKASYVPEPQPVETDYDLGAFYFPGWDSPAKWDPILSSAPERKPVLGWYDEGNPECVDWQIKWAVEHGIKTFYVDWYWSAGSRHLEHWVKAFEKARYRKYLKWCVMWANHNAANTHSEADQRAVTQYWLDHCFNLPEYRRINDMPVVIMWAPGNLRRDMGGSAGAKKLLDISQEMARAAGYKGIYFMAMCDNNAEAIRTLKDEGYAMTSIYHYMGSGGRARDPRHFSFDLVAASNLEHWQGLQQTGILPFLPNLSTGWDDRPWHGDGALVIDGRTVPLFRRICEDAKRFADTTGIKLLSLGPLNEWGEGSYAEPCAEFGFGMYDQVREVFCRKPAGGWPQDYGPADVGLGPYDYPEMTPVRRTAWDFSTGPEGWSALMAMEAPQVKDGVLSAVTTGPDPALGATLGALNAWQLRKLTFRMRLTGPVNAGDNGQLFWNLGRGVSEALSQRFPVTADGQWHEYTLDLGANPRWRGLVRSLRFDPCNARGVTVELAAVKFE